MKDGKRLEGTVKTLADRHADIPRATAAALSTMFGHRHYEDLLSIAGIAYVRVAASFRPEMAHNREAGFAPYVAGYLKRIVVRRFLRDRAKDVPVSLDTPVGKKKDGRLSDILPATRRCADADADGLFRSCLSILGGGQEYDFVMMRYRDGLKWRAIREGLGVNHAWVGKIRQRAMAKLRDALTEAA